MNRKRIIVACGAGIATSTVVLDHLEELFAKERQLVELIQCKISEVASMQDEADLIISTTILPTVYKIPAVSATAYISGIGMEKLDREIIRIINL
ncbi:PTS sugar transporter subunit IIB [Niallia taxi]|uniref:PTS sugar transporter subunit IIB n=1 Tax=Niallia taxi TaxID=2499688 RepID=UPI0015F782CD|nr:PTS sugar transporter subunit IIB [Niallia taxi]MCM3214174.1 PTS sugar transporter subunit IIB [Niallia taxi]MED4040863.1 PTS sugar transporter subunit IIB [Niallia taxi]